MSDHTPKDTCTVRKVPQSEEKSKSNQRLYTLQISTLSRVQIHCSRIYINKLSMHACSVVSIILFSSFIIDILLYDDEMCMCDYIKKQSNTNLIYIFL